MAGSAIFAVALLQSSFLLAICFSPIQKRLVTSPFTSSVSGHTYGHGSSSTQISAVSKRQTAIFDGAEFVSIESFLLAEDPSRMGDDPGLKDSSMPSMRAGFMTIVTGTTEESPSRRIVGVEKPSSNEKDKEDVISIGEGTVVYGDSVATVPEGVSDADAIATTAAALCGVHCGMPRPAREDKGGESHGCGKVVVLGGGDYACFTATGLCALGAEVSLVTTRPMGLKDTPLNPLRDTEVKTMGPAIGDEELGFSDALGKFDSVIDTLGDEAKLGQVSHLRDGVARIRKTGVAAKLRRANDCDRYISTLTRSQRYVLDEGLLFARGPVLKYQSKVEKKVDASQLRRILPPRNYGSVTLQNLFDNGIVFAADKNENGRNEHKDVFVRGWSFPDYTETEMWSRDSSGGSTVRFGFPAVDELNLQEEMDRIMKSMGYSPEETDPPEEAETPKETGPLSTEPSNAKTEKKKKTKKKQQNPFVLYIDGLPDLKEEIVSKNRDSVLFVSASYCKMCKSLSSPYVRMAREDKAKEGNLLFAKTNTAGKAGKQLRFSLQVDSVPSFILFRNGERFGAPLGITRLPSKKLDLAIEYLRTGKEWDPAVFKEEENLKMTKLK